MTVTAAHPSLISASSSLSRAPLLSIPSPITFIRLCSPHSSLVYPSFIARNFAHRFRSSCSFVNIRVSVISPFRFNTQAAIHCKIPSQSLFGSSHAPQDQCTRAHSCCVHVNWCVLCVEKVVVMQTLRLIEGRFTYVVDCCAILRCAAIALVQLQRTFALVRCNEHLLVFHVSARGRTRQQQRHAYAYD